MRDRWVGRVGDKGERSAKRLHTARAGLQVFLCCKVDQLFRLCRIAGKGLLDEDMLSILQGGFGKFMMRPHRSYDSDGINPLCTNSVGSLQWCYQQSYKAFDYKQNPQGNINWNTSIWCGTKLNPDAITVQPSHISCR
jgi:hypothetical protein